jgi:hypothetical protein
VAGQDAGSLLRPVYLFLALGVSVAVTLAGVSQLLFYALGRALGVPRPGGVGGSLALAAAGPTSAAIVYGVGWLYQRRALADQARLQAELPRQAGVRRLYTYLVALVALGVLAAGAGGVLWTLADLATNAPKTLDPATWWREQISLYTTLLAVGLPVWLLHWGPVARPAGDRPAAQAEARSLARRLYVYLTLLAGVLALLGAGAAAAKQLLDLALGAAATPSAMTNLARALAVAAVAGVAVGYHQRVLRADEEARGKRQEASAGAAPPVLPPGSGRPDAARPFGVVYRRGGAEASAWFASLDEAHAAREALRGDEEPLEWAVLVRQAEGAASDAQNRPIR